MPRREQDGRASAGSATPSLLGLQRDDGTALTLDLLRLQRELAATEFDAATDAQERVYAAAQDSHRPLTSQEANDARALEDARRFAHLRRRALGALESLALADLPLLLGRVR